MCSTVEALILLDQQANFSTKYIALVGEESYQVDLDFDLLYKVKKHLLILASTIFSFTSKLTGVKQ